MIAIRKNSGFTLVEALVVIGLIALVAALAAPNIVKWRRAARLRGAAENLKGDLELARLKAIQESGTVSVIFSADRYQVFLDNDKDWSPDTADSMLRERSLPPGVSIDLEQTSFGSPDDNTRFFARGTTSPGHAQLVNGDGNQKKITISNFGRITIESIKK